MYPEGMSSQGLNCCLVDLYDDLDDRTERWAAGTAGVVETVAAAVFGPYMKPILQCPSSAQGHSLALHVSLERFHDFH